MERFLEVADFVAIEWPKRCAYWGWNQTKDFLRKRKTFSTFVDACSVKLNQKGQLIRKTWTCCCLRCRKHAEPDSPVTFKVEMPKNYPVPKGIEQCSKFYFPVSGSKVHLNPTCSGMHVPMSKDVCAKCLSSLKKNKKA